ncbi:hypothetical protein L593_12750 [Salinarchaeum sp. Harcht-Bsk1]|uniref:PfkB family carbohydrate kinase n=1 Tax=Salinarchaeum sp. Harcht-Bsk1 TaxID=1333523 RepID=UPI000342295E|nr:PfkB family carbohydrate kinase [Salinarchaeum sp. Harcht-Bsk1]AGN02489.1 hypothetical protein L593_12750 [Salinarchaeum sp. Harcht-Bsk1]
MYAGVPLSEEMAYARLIDRLEAPASPTVTTLPDGSVDHFCSLADSVGPSTHTREAFSRAITGDRSSFRLDVESVESGGQSVNAALQLHALGSAVTAYGHFDAEIFTSLPFETVSMGTPADVYVLSFDDRDLMLVSDGDVGDWTLERLESVTDLDAAFDADAICCSNWAGVPGLEDAFHRLGDATFPRRPFVFDPGDVVGCAPGELESMCAALSALQETFDVVFNANREEIRATASILPGSLEDDGERLLAIREELGITAAVMHAKKEAATATADGLCTLPNLQVDRPTRQAGGGDRFSGGLGYALARGWDWETATACGNACASYYVESGTTGDPEELIAFLSDRSLRA